MRERRCLRAILAAAGCAAWLGAMPVPATAFETGADPDSEGSLGRAGAANTRSLPRRVTWPSDAPSIFTESTRVTVPSPRDRQAVNVRRSLPPADTQRKLQTHTVNSDGVVDMEDMSPADQQRIRDAITTIERERRGPDGRNIRRRSASMQSDGPPAAQGSRKVIGPDERSRVSDTRAFPYRAIGALSNGCTGTLIGPRHVLTAGHCVYKISENKWYRNITFSPGRNSDETPYGAIAARRLVSVAGWTNDHDERFDYALIVLAEDIGNEVGWLGFNYEEPMTRYTVNVAGYPGDKPDGTLWRSACRIEIVRGQKIYYPCDTYGGMSGSAVYAYQVAQNRRTVFGIHAYGGNEANSGTRIDKALYERILGWKRQY